MKLQGERPGGRRDKDGNSRLGKMSQEIEGKKLWENRDT
jgi:hypothetical protein